MSEDDKIDSRYNSLTVPDFKKEAELPPHLTESMSKGETYILTTMGETELKADWAVARIVEMNERDRALDRRLQRIENLVQLLTSYKVVITGIVLVIGKIAYDLLKLYLK